MWLAALAYPAGVSPLAWAVLVLFGLVMGWQAFVACQYVYGSPPPSWATGRSR